MFVVFTSVPLILAEAPPLATPPVIPPEIAGADQLYVVPDGTRPFVPSTGTSVNVPPLQIVAVIADIEGFGLMVTITLNVAPVHPVDSGVIVYVAVCTVLVRFVSVPVILPVPLPDVPPENPVPAGADHE